VDLSEDSSLIGHGGAQNSVIRVEMQPKRQIRMRDQGMTEEKDHN